MRQGRLLQLPHHFPHFVNIEHLPGAHRTMAGNRYRQPLIPIPTPTIEQFLYHTTPVLTDKRRRHRPYQKGPLPKGLDSETKLAELTKMATKDGSLPGADLQGQWLKQRLNFNLPTRPAILNLLKQDALVSGMLVDKI